MARISDTSLNPSKPPGRDAAAAEDPLFDPAAKCDSERCRALTE